MINNIQIQDILKQIVTQFGKHIFDKSESRRLEGILSDYITENRAIQKLFRRAVQDGVAHEALQCYTLDKATKTIRINALKRRFKEDNFLEESRAYFVVDCFAYALGFITNVQDIASDSSRHEKNEKTDVITEDLTPIGRNGKWGYIDKNKNEVIPLKYSLAGDFNLFLQGLALVKLNDKCHYIDTKGNRWKYDEAYRFDEGLAPVKLNGKWGYIDKNKNEITPLKYDKAWSFNEHLQDLALVKLNDKCHYIDTKGNLWKYDEAYRFDEGLAPVKLNGKWGYIDKNKNEIIPLKYDYALGFNQHLQGLALVKLNSKCHYIDTKGNRWKYDEAYDFNESLARVMLNGKWGYIDRNKNEVIPLNYIYAGDFNLFLQGLAYVGLKNGKCHYIDTKGKRRYDQAWSFNEHLQGLALVKLSDKCHYIDTNGNRWKYDEAYSFYESLARVMLNGKWGYIDRNKNEVIPLKYDYALSFNQHLQGLAMVKLNDKCHYTDTKGNRWKYDEAYGFHEGLARVMLNGKWGYIDKNKNEVIPLQYDYAWNFNEHLQGLAMVKLNDKCHYIDKMGNLKRRNVKTFIDRFFG
jgi:hypothetical protein